MFLINIFQAIINTSYSKVKEQIKHTNEQWSLKRVIFFCCYKNKPYTESIKIKSLDEDLTYDIHKQIFETRMNINTASAAKAYEELKKEIDEIKIIDDEFCISKEVLKKVEYAYETKNLGSLSYEDNIYKNIEHKHIKCYRLNYLKKSINIAEAIEQDILTIERYHDHLNNYINHFNFEKLRQEYRKNNEFKYDISAMFGKNIVELTKDVDEIREIFDEINKLDESMIN